LQSKMKMQHSSLHRCSSIVSKLTGLGFKSASQ
jgi:hypothetical protein